jgi:hypothetical protein
MSTLQFKAYQILREKFGESDSQVFIEFLEVEQGRTLTEDKAKTMFLTEDKVKTFLSTKEDINRLELNLKTETNRLDLNLKTEINRLDLNLRTETNRLETKLAETESRIVRQIYIANIVQLLATVGSFLAIVKFLFTK